jgi:hypothetical protein
MMRLGMYRALRIASIGVDMRWRAHSIPGRRAALVVAIAAWVLRFCYFCKMEPAVTAGLYASKAARTSSFSPGRTSK